MIGETALNTVDAAASDPAPDASPDASGDLKADIRGDSTTLPARSAPDDDAIPTARPREIGGRDGLEPTRYGDWEKNGRCIDF